jgi:hypothetical protein
MGSGYNVPENDGPRTMPCLPNAVANSRTYLIEIAIGEAKVSAIRDCPYFFPVSALEWRGI